MVVRESKKKNVPVKHVGAATHCLILRQQAEQCLHSDHPLITFAGDWRLHVSDDSCVSSERQTRRAARSTSGLESELLPATSGSFDVALRPQRPYGLVQRRGAQDVHLFFHTVPELSNLWIPTSVLQLLDHSKDSEFQQLCYASLTV